MVIGYKLIFLKGFICAHQAKQIVIPKTNNLITMVIDIYKKRKGMQNETKH